MTRRSRNWTLGSNTYSYRTDVTWPITTFTDWPHFLDYTNHVESLPTVVQVANLYRGQADSSWPLKSSLERALPNGVTAEAALKLERALGERFRERAHVHIRGVLPTKDDLFHWWALMQHHGAPTRLLDWTSSPFIAAYFAAEQQPDVDGAIWMIHAASLVVAHEKQVKAGLVNPEAFTTLSTPEFIAPLWEARASPRAVAQQSFYTASSSPVASQEAQVEAALLPRQEVGVDTLRKLIIPSRLKPTFLRHLRAMNVEAASLFPGLDGIGRSLSELARIERTLMQGQ